MLNKKSFFCYLAAVILAVVFGMSDVPILWRTGMFCAEVFIRIFRCISMPIISLSVIVALASCGSSDRMRTIWKRTLFYTFSTTIAAATVAAVLYTIILPANVTTGVSPAPTPVARHGYLYYLLDVIPDDVMAAFIHHKVLSVLLISIITGISIKFIPEEDTKHVVLKFFQGLHGIFLHVTRFVVRALPVGMFGFICVSIQESRTGVQLAEMGKYFLVIVLANILQGMFVLPLWLLLKGINPLKVFRGMFPALSVAFFSKSSSAALPVTMEMAEKNLSIQRETSRFVLPLCTTINMNGCAAFIFTTVTYLMQNYGSSSSLASMVLWIFISTVAAVGNAGVPMGCFMLSASLLSSMGIPTQLMGIILPFYGIIDMVETALNVWSDSCVATAIDSPECLRIKKFHGGKIC
ncbi:MAG: dicarboxylate/amino acid:cation symporter [Puniceicoccales bacterium]|jgi:Na+/H+-dicarboxylate symporter|nr:dicarboxylate/amino acid:cation symporter [Puniceicoccales bacterium]